MYLNLIKAIIRVLLSLALFVQCSLIFITLKYNGIPFPKQLLLSQLPEAIKVEAQQGLFYFPCHFNLINPTIRTKGSDIAQIDTPLISLSWLPKKQALGLWIIHGNQGEIETKYYPNPCNLSRFKIKFNSKKLLEIYARITDTDKSVAFTYENNYRGLGYNKQNNILKSFTHFKDDKLVETLIRTLYTSRKTALKISVKNLPNGLFDGKAELVSKKAYIDSNYFESIYLTAKLTKLKNEIYLNSNKYYSPRLNLKVGELNGSLTLSSNLILEKLKFSGKKIHYKDTIIGSGFGLIAPEKSEKNYNQILRLETALFDEESHIIVESNFYPKARFNIFTFDGLVAPESIYSRLPAFNYTYTINKPFHIKCLLKLDENLKINSIKGFLEGENFMAEQQYFNYFQSKFHGFRNEFESESHLRIGNRNLSIKGTYYQQTKDYHLLVDGQLLPNNWNTLMPSWWESIFQKVSYLENSQIAGDFIIRGQSDKMIPDLFLGSVKMKNVIYRDVLFNLGDLLIESKKFCTKINLNRVETPQGHASGFVQTTIKPDGFKNVESIRLDLNGALTIKNAKLLAGEKASQALEPFRSEHAHSVSFKGVFFNPHYQKHIGKSYYNLYINDDKPLYFYGMPIDDLFLRIYGRHSKHFIRSGFSSFAGGALNFQADIDLNKKKVPKLALDLELIQSDYDLTMYHLFGTHVGDGNPKNKRALKLDVKMNSFGDLNKIDSHIGSGKIIIDGDTLSQLYLLGPFSKALNELNISIGTFKLNRLESHFLINKKWINVPIIEMNGIRSYVYGDGRIYIPDSSINFSIQVDPLKNSNLSFSKFGALGDFLNPVTKILNFKVTGTPDKQKWRSRFDPRNLF